MKIAVCSDLHLEFGDINIKNESNAYVLVLSGDILIAEDLHDHPDIGVNYSLEILDILGSRQAKALAYRNFLKRVSFQFPHVVYVAGNHEFYHGNWYNTINVLKDECARFPNIHYLEDESVLIDGITFIGSTLWTDLNKGDPITMQAITNDMSDYRHIRNDQLGYTKLRPANTVGRHARSVKFIVDTLATVEGKCVVCTHHAPSFASVDPMYKDQRVINGAYASDLSELILDNEHIALWTHGHMHSPSDYVIGNTRVVCNPRGYYGYETSAYNYEAKLVEI